MKTKISKLSHSSDDADIIREAGEIIRQGGLVAFPTETVYGLGGDALNAASAERIFAAKGRPADNPLIVHICRISDIEKIAQDIPDVFYTLADKFWPGPLTMILKKSPIVPESTSGGLSTVAVRMPDNQAALSLIETAGGFIAAPSANTSGRPSTTLGKYVIEDMDGRIDMIIDDGQSKIGLESLILDLTTSPPELLRPGSITKEMIESVIGTELNISSDEADEGDKPPRAPGMKYRHYAPKGRMSIIMGGEETVISYINEKIREDKENNLITGVIASEKTSIFYQADRVKCIGNRQDEEIIARNLYRILREFDEEITDVIYSESFSGGKLGNAVMNRLLKAASHQIINV